MKPTLITNIHIINEGEIFKGGLLIKNGIIDKIFTGIPPEYLIESTTIIDGSGKYLMPGIIDDQVHFREPGLTHKADIYTESKAAVAGGITSFMEMPNTVPQATTQKLLEEKFSIAADKSMANYSFYMGATNDNVEELIKINPVKVCGIKVFMGSSTGNMLVDNHRSLQKIFSINDVLIATHCEDEATIKKNIDTYINIYGENIPINFHPVIRSREACYKSSSFAVEMAKKLNTRLHVLHISTADEISLFQNKVPLKEKRITAEVCVHHLWFCDDDYERLGTKIKWNPAVKTAKDRDELLTALLDDRLDVVATDHAPHTLVEKNNNYLKAPSGGPLVQHSLPVMLQLHQQGKISLEKIVEKMCHAPAILFRINRRGFIREGYHADLVMVDLNKKWKVTLHNILYKCNWSPFENHEFNSMVTHTFVNGRMVYNMGVFDETFRGERIEFGG